MKHRLITATLAAAGLLLVPGEVFAHGGQYRGPGDTVPPGSGGGSGGGPGTPGPGGPGSPGGSSPGTPGPGAPQGPGGTGAVSPGITMSTDPDLTEWTFWWEFNKDPYLDLKSHVYGGGAATGSDGFYLGRGERLQSKGSLRPSAAQIRGKVVPALLAALEKETNNDIVTGCLIALAKIGDADTETGASPFEEIIRQHLGDKNQEISETAAVALGILANEASISLLSDLVLDTPAGRGAVKSGEVNYRTRAFAAFGLGLIGARTAKDEARLQVVERLMAALHDDSTKSRDLQVACLVSLGLVPLSVDTPDTKSEKPAKGEVPRLTCRTQQLDWLLDYLAEEDNHPLVRAHAPTALGRLLADLPTAPPPAGGLSPHEDYKNRIARALLTRMAKRTGDRNEVVQSAVLALGLVGDADSDAIDVQIRKALAAVPESISDKQAQYFSLIAMAHVGGNMGLGENPEAGTKEASKYIAERLSRGKGGTPSWAGVAAGVFGRLLPDNQFGQSADLRTALRLALRDEKSATDIGAYAIGCGIVRDIEATGILLDKLRDTTDEMARGYVAVSLGLMNARDAIEPIQQLVERSKHRPDLLRQAAIALGLLGDKQVVKTLVGMLGEAKGFAVQAAVSSALGFIGDQDSIDPLVAMLEDTKNLDGARGFAAVALGIVADKEPLPWNSKISVHLNYLASTSTLNDTKGTGILNIL